MLPPNLVNIALSKKTRIGKVPPLFGSTEVHNFLRNIDIKKLA